MWSDYFMTFSCLQTGHRISSIEQESSNINSVVLTFPGWRVLSACLFLTTVNRIPAADASAIRIS